MKAATQSVLAKKLGLSRSTIAAALNPNSTVKLRDSTRRRILKEAGLMNYRPHHQANILRGGRSGLIGIVHFGGLSQVAAERAWYASAAIRQAGYHVLFSDISWSPEDATASFESMLDARVEGVIVAGLDSLESMQALALLQKAGVPLVTLSGNEIKGVPHIRGDAHDAMRRLTHHLTSLGRRRLLLLTHFSSKIGPGTYTWAARDRLEGFRAGLADSSAKLVKGFTRDSTGSPVEGRVILSETPYDHFDPFKGGRNAMRDVLSSEDRPDAVLCGNDDWAVGALAACREANIRVPTEIAITGYDNTAAAAYLDVPLTTVAQPSQPMAERAVELLQEMINGRTISKSAQLLKLPCRLVIRQSCGAAIGR